MSAPEIGALRVASFSGGFSKFDSVGRLVGVSWHHDIAPFARLQSHIYRRESKVCGLEPKIVMDG